MPIHPRSVAASRARDAIAEQVNALAVHHNLTHVELFAILLDVARLHATTILQRERHPDRPELPADLA